MARPSCDMTNLRHCTFWSARIEGGHCAWHAVENERLSWELEQVQGLVDQQELAQMRSDLDSLRSQMLLMAEREDNMQVTPLL